MAAWPFTWIILITSMFLGTAVTHWSNMDKWGSTWWSKWYHGDPNGENWSKIGWVMRKKPVHFWWPKSEKKIVVWVCRENSWKSWRLLRHPPPLRLPLAIFIGEKWWSTSGLSGWNGFFPVDTYLFGGPCTPEPEFSNVFKDVHPPAAPVCWLLIRIKGVTFQCAPNWWWSPRDHLHYDCIISKSCLNQVYMRISWCSNELSPSVLMFRSLYFMVKS